MSAGIIPIVLLSASTGCTSDGKATPVATGATSAQSAARPSTQSPRVSDSAMQQPPALDSGETLAGRQKATSGNATVDFSAGRKNEALVVAVRCEGRGTIKVSVSSVDVSFPLECRSDEVSTTYNQVAVTGSDREGSVSVEAPAAVRWSMTIGRGEPAAEESPGAP
ncbi:hypothetical protein ACIPPJ_27150 [Streptomyces sp. NPDC086091]|uniref:hypothetical protein n=1 Tax=Streptomyces sp. NPDC086091 TaxID=3365751 RepID=UPI003811ADD2